MNTTLEKRIGYKITVHLADNEWGNEKMKEVAMATFADTPQRPLIVEVVEHGGWHLTYTNTGQVIGTANDSWNPPAYVREYWNSAEWKYLPSIRR